VAEGADVVIVEEELGLVVVSDVDFGPVVVALLLLLPPVLLLLPPPPRTVALLVAVAAELPWATLEGRPGTKVGPGIV
jgi:hypothetical protein